MYQKSTQDLNICAKMVQKGGEIMYSKFFSERLKQARKNAGKSQIEVEIETGINRASLSRYETGEREPSLENIGKLAEYYNVSIDWLFGNVVQKKS